MNHIYIYIYIYIYILYATWEIMPYLGRNNALQALGVPWPAAVGSPGPGGHYFFHGNALAGNSYFPSDVTELRQWSMLIDCCMEKGFIWASQGPIRLPSS